MLMWSPHAKQTQASTPLALHATVFELSAVTSVFLQTSDHSKLVGLTDAVHALTAHAYLQKRALQSLRSLGLADDIMTAALAEQTSTASRSADLLICNLSAWKPISAAGLVTPDHNFLSI